MYAYIPYPHIAALAHSVFRYTAGSSVGVYR